MLIKSNITLASSSKRRLDLLRKIGIEPYRIINPEINEMNFEDIPINKRPREIAFQKALAAKEKNPATDNFIIAGELSGKKHFVLGGLCVLSPNGEISKRTVKTEVFFKKLSNTEISDEDLQKDGLNKAGGYAIQNLGSLIVSKIKGSYFNVVGLCLFELVQMLKGLGWKNIN